MDRGHSELAARLTHFTRVLPPDRLHCRGSENPRSNVAVCGGLASDPVAVPIFIGLGVHDSQWSPPVIPQLKALIFNAQCGRLHNTCQLGLERDR